MRTGRPPKITTAWADKTAETLPEMFKEGQGVAEVWAELNICKNSFYKAIEISSKFSDAYKRGCELSEAWWIRLGRDGASKMVDIQPATWIFNMKNRFDWREKADNTIANPDGSNIVPPSLTVNFTKADAPDS